MEIISAIIKHHHHISSKTTNQLSFNLTLIDENLLFELLVKLRENNYI